MSDEGKSNFEKHSWCLEQLKAAQDADHDNRENAREAHAFVDARQGQWEQHWWNANDGNPRYTFDMTNPIIDQIAGDMESKDFDIRIRPSGGDATKETAATYDDLVRNIENVSNSTDVYNRAGRNMITAGLDGWRVTQRYSEGDSFDQDLIIEKVGNYLDRVWLGPHEEADGSDARYGWVLTGIDEAEYEEEYPERKATSVEGDRTGNVYYYRNDLVMVGEFLYLVPLIIDFN